MSVEQIDVVDIVSVDRATGCLRLTIADHLDWTDEAHHLRLLQDKINHYVHFIEGGQLYDLYPDAVGRAISINVVTKYNVTQRGKQFFDAAQRKLAESGIELIHRTETS